MVQYRPMKDKLSSEISVLREIASVVMRERNVHKLLEDVISILEKSMGMFRGTFTLLEGDELRIEASAASSAPSRMRLGQRTAASATC